MNPVAKGISEDWLSVWIGLLVFVLALGMLAGTDILGWVVTTGVWTDPSKALNPVSKAYSALSGVGALIVTYVALFVVMTAGAVALKADLKRFALGFTAWMKEAVRPELYIKAAIVLLGGFLGIMAATQPVLAKSVLFRGLAAIIEAYLIYWAVVYFVARKWFGFSREWAAPLASGISICGVSAAIATGGAIRARPIVPIMVASLVVIFA